MADKQTAIENVRSVARTFQAVIDLAAQLDGVVSVEQAVNEANVKLVRLQREIAQAEATLGEAVRAKEGTDQATAEIRESTEKWVAESKADVEELALRMTTIARDEAEKMREQAAADVATAQKELADIAAQSAAKRQELDDIEARIARAKAKMAELLGA